MAITINGDGLIDIGGTTSTQGRVRLAEDADNGTNYVELTAPASVASNRVITFPDATTTVVGTDTTQTLTNKTLTSPTINGGTVSSATLTSPTISGTPVVNGSLVVSGTSITLTNQTAPTISGIPSWAKRVVLLLSQVSTNGSSGIFVRLGTSGGIDSTTTYNNLNHILGTGVDRFGTATGAPYTSIFSITAGTTYTSAGMFFNGQLTFSLVDTNLWVVSGVVSTGNVAGSMYTYLSTGSKLLSSALTQIQLSTNNGTDQFDAGTINILYE